MVAQPAPTMPPAESRPDRCPWLALATGGPVASLVENGAEGRLHVTSDPGAFERTLIERRRRPSLRIVHISRVEDIDARLAALRAGVDEAVSDLIDPIELLGRMELLESRVMARVWGHDHEGDPRTVDVHIRWLRSKLEPDPDVPAHLVTVRGVGYRLDPSSR